MTTTVELLPSPLLAMLVRTDVVDITLGGADEAGTVDVEVKLSLVGVDIGVDEGRGVEEVVGV